MHHREIIVFIGCGSVQKKICHAGSEKNRITLNFTRIKMSYWRIGFFHGLYSTLLHLRYSARSHPIPAIDLIHSRLDLLHSRLDLIHTRLDLTVYELYTYFRHFSYIFARTLELLLPCCFWYPCDARMTAVAGVSLLLASLLMQISLLFADFSVAADSLCCLCLLYNRNASLYLEIVSLMDLMFLASVLLKDPCCCCKPCCCR
jgi:hypothetical protein